MANSVSSLKGANSSTAFNDMANNGFAVVTVYDALVWDYDTVKSKIMTIESGNVTYHKIDAILTGLLSDDIKNKAMQIESLTASTATSEAETASVKAGIRNTTLFKYLKDKTCTLEISDALGSLESWTAFQGAIGEDFNPTAAASEWSGKFASSKNSGVIHLGTSQPSYKTILGKTYFLDSTSGNEVEVYILFYKFMGDGAMTLAMDPSSDASVFSISGELAGQKILVGPYSGTASGDEETQQATVFYSICSADFLK